MVKESAEMEKINELIVELAEESGNHPETATVPWYQQNISLEDAKMFIKTNIASAARSFIAVGFYLKCVRDKELYIEDGYESIWDFAKEEYGISKSTASRYMTMNDKFSENGNSPIIQKEYQAFDKSKLQEMMYLEDEQLKEVTSDFTVKDIRNLRPPKEMPYFTLPGQMEFETDFPEIFSEESPALSAEATAPIEQKQTFAMDISDFLPDDESVATSQLPEPLPEVFEHFTCDSSPYGWTWSEVVQRYLQELNDIVNLDWNHLPLIIELDTCGRQYTGKAMITLVIFYVSDDRGTRPSFEVEIERLRQEYEYWHGCKEEPEPEPTPENESRELSAYGTPKMVYPPDSYVSIAGCEGGHCCFSCHRECDIRQEDCCCVHAPMGNPFPCEILDQFDMYDVRVLDRETGGQCQFVDLGKAYHRAGDGEPVPCCEECETICEYACSRALKSAAAVPESEPVPTEKETWNTTPSSCPHTQIYSCTLSEAEKGVIGDGTNCAGACCWECDSHGDCKNECNSSANREQDQEDEQPVEQETIIDADFVEIKAEPAVSYDERTLNDMIEFEHELLNTMGDYWVTNLPPVYTQHVMTLQALRDLKEKHSLVEPQVIEGEQLDEPDPVVQPELPLLKNNDQRKAWIKDYKAWKMWYRDENIDVNYYKFDFKNGSRLIAVEYPDREGYWYEGGRDEVRYHLLVKGKSKYGNKGTFDEKFRNDTTSESELVEYLKDIQKKGKG